MGKSSARNGNTKPADRIVVRRSGVHGRGVFTKGRIRKGARIIEYVGRHLPWKEAQDAPPLDPKNPHYTMLFHEPSEVVTILARNVVVPAQNNEAFRAWNHLTVSGQACTWEQFPEALRVVLPKLGWR